MQRKWQECKTPEHWVCDFCNNESPPDGCGHMEEWEEKGMTMWHYGDRAICVVCVSLIGELNAA